ncbi:hypothetical protein [Paenibacillus sp. XY044]|uniref:hypothetical protein n=1 Tax=Paenibacillus sp. XY044 TaxID=2026089 RepID=UPI000B997F6D|nr:hypothetical protein [Paenibacillus sp. XY044]OZB95978.1 hypothetical protein CJP46_08540 [Paenibacillus sp. XY044]
MKDRRQDPDDDKELTLEALENYEGARDTIESADYIDADAVNWHNVTSPDEDISLDTHMLDIDRMVNEGLGGGNITADNGYIGASTTDTMVVEPGAIGPATEGDPEEG